MLSFEEFVLEVKQHLLLLEMGNGDEAKFMTILQGGNYKTVGVYMEMLFREKGTPIVNLDPYYNQYVSGDCLEDVLYDLRQILRTTASEKVLCNVRAEHFEDIQDKIVFRLLNWEQSKEQLKGHIYKRVHDMVVQIGVLISFTERQYEVQYPQKQWMQNYGVTVDEMYQLALENTPRLFPARLRSIDDILEEINKGNYEKHSLWVKCAEHYEGKFEDVKVLDNIGHANGAVAFLYPEVLAEYANEVGDDVLLLPSSTDEFIVAPHGKLMYNGDFLKDLIREANNAFTKREKLVSNHVYLYKREKGTVQKLK